jgi:hypothetical protein
MKEGRQRLSFTGGDEFTTAVTNSRRRRREPEAAMLGNWCSSECVGVLRRQREAQEFEHELKYGQREEGEGRRAGSERRRLPLMVAAITARC